VPPDSPWVPHERHDSAGALKWGTARRQILALREVTSVGAAAPAAGVAVLEVAEQVLTRCQPIRKC